MRRSATAMVVGLFLCGAVFQASAASLEDLVRKLRAEIRRDVGVRLPPVPVPANNRQTREKVALGEALFFDPNLSSSAEVACATCHAPEKGFSDGKEVSPGCNGAQGRRNSSTIYQTAYLSHLFWDGRVQLLEQQALSPIVDPVEMANTWDNVISYLRTGVHPASGKEFPHAKKFYETAFGKVFGGDLHHDGGKGHRRVRADREFVRFPLRPLAAGRRQGADRGPEEGHAGVLRPGQMLGVSQRAPLHRLRLPQRRRPRCRLREGGAIPAEFRPLQRSRPDH